MARDDNQTNSDPPRNGPPEHSRRVAPIKESAEKLIARVMPPMLAKLGSSADEKTVEAHDKGYLLEIKFDGYRVLAGMADSQVVLRGRNDTDHTERLIGIANGLRRLRIDNTVLDGEVIALDSTGRMSFSKLQSTLSPSAQSHRLDRGAQKSSLRYVVFDLLIDDGRDLRQRPLAYRRKRLEALANRFEPPVTLSAPIDGPIARARKAAKALGLEGVVAKNLTAPYVSERSKAFIKFKIRQKIDAAVCGFTLKEKHAERISSLLLCVYSGDETPVFIGKVGAGFSSSERSSFYLRLSKTVTGSAEEQRPTFFVDPTIAVTVEYLEFTRHGHLRQPTFIKFARNIDPFACKLPESIGG